MRDVETVIEKTTTALAALEEEWPGDPLRDLLNYAEESGRALNQGLQAIKLRCIDTGDWTEYEAAVQRVIDAANNLTAMACFYHHAPAEKKLDGVLAAALACQRRELRAEWERLREDELGSLFRDE